MDTGGFQEIDGSICFVAHPLSTFGVQSRFKRFVLRCRNSQPVLYLQYISDHSQFSAIQAVARDPA
jgi:hypothetical protein